VWSYITANTGFVKRVLDYFSFAFMALLVGLFQKHDIIIATSPQFFTTWAGYAISKIRKKPWIFELRDIWPESIRSVSAMRHGRAYEWLERVEIGLYKDADRVVAVTEAFKRNLERRGINPEKIEVVTNGANMDLFAPRKKDEELLVSLGLKNKFVIGYIGTHGMAHSLDFIVQSIAKIDDKSIHFLFVGNGSVKNKIVKLASSLSLNNITFLDAISKEDVPRYLSIIDVSLAPLIRSDTFKTVIPSKIFEASAMQKPSLLGVEGQAQEIIEKYDAGLCFEPENESDFIAKVNLLKSDKAVYEKYKEGCLRLAKDYNRKKLAEKMLKIIQDVVNIP
jgi:glycosyltransferase involved in cell wall biosynthesis